jgi:hypothetical protein
MEVQVILYTILLAYLNYGVPFFILGRRLSDVSLIFIIGGILWIIESVSFSYALDSGYDNDQLLAVFYLFAIIPIPYILMLIGVIIKIVQK